MIEKIIENLNRKIGTITGFHHLKISVWGNDLLDSFQYNYDFHDHADSFLSLKESEYQPAEIILIVGPINYNQLDQIKKRYESLQSASKYVIHVKGSMHKTQLENSYMSVQNLGEYLPIDLEYEKYPIDIGELLDQIIDTKDGILHEK